MTYSLNETSALMFKAARGAGMTWGYAQEASFAALWCVQRCLDGTAALCALLQAAQDNPDMLHKTGPIAQGCALTDLAYEEGPLPAYDRLVAPNLILPYAAQRAALEGCAIRLEGDSWTALVHKDGLEITGHIPLTPQPLRLSYSDERPAPASCQDRVALAPHDLATLTQFAHRTYAPATEASRLAGAGAGLNDND